MAQFVLGQESDMQIKWINSIDTARNRGAIFFIS